MMHNSKGKLALILMAFVVLALASVACGTVTPGDGTVRDAVIEVNSAIKDTAGDAVDAVEATGEGLEVEEKGTVILDAVWDVAIDIAASEPVSDTQQGE